MVAMKIFLQLSVISVLMYISGTMPVSREGGYSFLPYLIPRVSPTKRGVSLQNGPVKVLKGNSNQPESTMATTSTKSRPRTTTIRSKIQTTTKLKTTQNLDRNIEQPSHMMLWDDVEVNAGMDAQSGEHQVKFNYKPKISSTQPTKTHTFPMDVESVATRAKKIGTAAPKPTITFNFPTVNPIRKFYTLQPTTSGGFIESFRNMLKNMTSFFNPLPVGPKPFTLSVSVKSPNVPKFTLPIAQNQKPADTIVKNIASSINRNENLDEVVETTTSSAHVTQLFDNEPSTFMPEISETNLKSSSGSGMYIIFVNGDKLAM